MFGTQQSPLARSPSPSQAHSANKIFRAFTDDWWHGGSPLLRIIPCRSVHSDLAPGALINQGLDKGWFLSYLQKRFTTIDDLFEEVPDYIHDSKPDGDSFPLRSESAWTMTPEDARAAAYSEATKEDLAYVTSSFLSTNSSLSFSISPFHLPSLFVLSAFVWVLVAVSIDRGYPGVPTGAGRKVLEMVVSSRHTVTRHSCRCWRTDLVTAPPGVLISFVLPGDLSVCGRQVMWAYQVSSIEQGEV